MQARALRSSEQNEAVQSPASQAATPPYLFADSEPFSHEFDCISTLSGLVDLAAVVLAEARAEKDIRAAMEGASADFTEQLTRLTALEREIAQLAPHTLLLGRDHDASLERVSTELGESVSQLCGSARERLEGALRLRRLEAEAQMTVRQETARSAVQRFLVGYELAVTSQRFQVDLSARGYALKLTQTFVGGIEVEFRAHEASTAFSAPRRLAQLAGPLRLPIGHKRGLLSHAMVLDSRALGDYFVTGLRLAGDELELELRNKRDAPDALRLQLVRYNDGVTGQIVRSEDPGHSFDIPLEHAPKLAPVFQALRAACCVPRETFALVTDLSIDGVTARDAQGPVRFLDRLVALFEPIVSQLIAHGAATSELSLKRDLGDGRREERFVSLAHLVDKVSSLSREDRARLSGLGLDRDYRRTRSGEITLSRADRA